MAVWGGLTNSCEKKRCHNRQKKKKEKAEEPEIKLPTSVGF